MIAPSGVADARINGHLVVYFDAFDAKLNNQRMAVCQCGTGRYDAQGRVSHR